MSRATSPPPGQTDARSGARTARPSELFRERQVARYYVTLPQKLDAQALEAAVRSPAFVPRSSSDPALTAFAQLVALRLDVDRAMISLIDSSHQYILAESTKTLSLQCDKRHDANDSLYFGTATFPRSQSISQILVTPANEVHSEDPNPDTDGILEVSNVQEHARYRAFSEMQKSLELCYYAGIAIALPDGTKIGSLTAVSSRPHPALTPDQRVFLRDMARTAMTHLEAIRVGASHQRRDKLVTGLESFVSGLGDIQSIAVGPTSTESKPRSTSTDSVEEPSTLPRAKLEFGAEPDHQNPTGGDEVVPNDQKPLWERALPPAAKPMFSRAANIIRQTGDYDGVVFFYMSSTSTNSKKYRTRRPHRSESRNTDPAANVKSKVANSAHTQSSSSSSELSDDSHTEGGEARPEHIPNTLHSPCPVLSCSLSSEQNAINARDGVSLFSFAKRDLRRLAGKAPRGRTFVFNRHGLPLYTGTSSSGSSVELSDHRSVGASSPDPNKGRSDSDSHARNRNWRIGALRRLSPAGKAFVCLPLWDFERRRWFAYAICWSNGLNQDPTFEADLHYLRLFGHSIMNALAQIDANETNRLKTNFISSISHELRSPLHGMLGATSFLQDSKLSRFQSEMVDAIVSSGRTLLDTIDHVMDFAELNLATSTDPKVDAARGQDMEQAPDDAQMVSSFDMVAVLEETLDTVAMGYSAQSHLNVAQEPSESSSRSSLAVKATQRARGRMHQMTPKRRGVRLAVEVTYRSNWHVNMEAGAWRRLVMNLFGNALKYTNDGIINVRLQETHQNGHSGPSIQFSVVDTGIGMSDDFMENHLFKAFSQENSFTAGTGLGLNIVDQIARNMGGRVIVNSLKGVGTNIGLSLPLTVVEAGMATSAGQQSLVTAVQKLQGIRTCSLEIPFLEASTKRSVTTLYMDGFANQCKEWFGIDLTRLTSWNHEDTDIVILPEPCFKHLEAIRTSARGTRMPSVLIIVSDALEMQALRTDVRLSEATSVIELICQPIGPYKLAKSLERCLAPASAKGVPSSVSSSPVQRPVADSTASPLLYPAPGTPLPGESETTDVLSDRVLIVDDNPLNLRLLSTLIRKLTVPYSEAKDGQEAVHMFKGAQNSFKCILMDISMPVMDGMTATRHIRELERISGKPQTPIIALTGLTSTAARSEAMESGMDDFLTKPVSFPLLRQKIAAIFDLQQKTEKKSANASA